MSKLVDERFACIEGYPKHGLNVGHTMMNKFFDPKDRNFELVSMGIEDLVRLSVEILRSSTKSEKTAFSLPLWYLFNIFSPQ